MSSYFTIRDGSLAEDVYSIPVNSVTTCTDTVVISSLNTDTAIFSGVDVNLYGVALNLSARPDPVIGNLTVQINNQQTHETLASNTYSLSSFTKYDGSYNYITIHPQNWQVLKFNIPLTLSALNTYYLKLSTDIDYISFVGKDIAIDEAQNANGILNGKISNLHPYQNVASRSICLASNSSKFIEFNANPNYALGNSFTVEGYFYFTDLASTWIPLINSGSGWGSTSSGSWGLAYNTDEACLYFWRDTETSESFFKTRANLPINKWVFISVSRINNILSFWVDGICLNADTRHFTSYTIDNPLEKLFINLFTKDSVDYSGNYYVSNLCIKNNSIYNSTFNVSLDPLSVRKSTSILYAEPYSDYYLASELTNPLIFKLFEEQLNIYNDVDQSLFVYQKNLPTDSLINDNNLPLFNIANYSHLIFDKKYYYTAPVTYGNFDIIDFTVEGWVYVPSISAAIEEIQQICSYSLTTDVDQTLFNLDLVFSATDSPKLKGIVAAGSTIYGAASGDITLDAWNHICLTRKQNTLYTFIQGVKQTEILIPSVLNNSSNYIFSIGGNKNGNQLYYGYLSNIRFHKGYAVYEEDFSVTPPEFGANITSPEPLVPFSKDVEGVSLLSFIPVASDIGNINTSFNNTTGVFISSESPFLSSEEKTIFFNNSLQNVTFIMPNTSTIVLEDKDFTIETWINLSSLPASNAEIDRYILIETSSSSEIVLSLSVGINNIFLKLGNQPGYSINTNTTFAHSLDTSTWHHIAVVYKNRELYFLIDGVAALTTSTNPTNSYIFSPLFPIQSVSSNNGRIKFHGYISNLRVVRGSALYSKDFIPLKNNTVNLLSPSPYELSEYNDGKGNHVGDNVVSYSKNISPYSIDYNFGSFYFNGASRIRATGDNYITAFENFCIEFWANVSSSAQNNLAFDLFNTVSFSIQLKRENASSNFSVFVTDRTNSPAITLSSGNNILLNNWYYIALVRKNNKIFLYVNNNLIDSKDFTRYVYGPTIYFGGENDASKYFYGYLSDIRISGETNRFSLSGTNIPEEPLSNTIDVSASVSTQSLSANLRPAITIVKDSPFVNYPENSCIDIKNTSKFIDRETLDLSGAFTIEGWIKGTDTYETITLLTGKSSFNGSTADWLVAISFSKDFSTKVTGSSLMFSFNRIPIAGNGGSYWYRAIVGYPFAKNQWYHVAVVRYNSSNTFLFYINGNLFIPIEEDENNGKSIHTNFTPNLNLLLGDSNSRILEGGRISNLRITSSAVYFPPSDLSPPSVTIEPVVTDTNSLIHIKAKEEDAGKKPRLYFILSNGSISFGGSQYSEALNTCVAVNDLYLGAAAYKSLDRSASRRIGIFGDITCADDFTLEFFLKTKDIKLEDRFLLSMGLGSWWGSLWGFTITLSKNNKIKAGFSGNNPSAQKISINLESSQSLNINEWYHISIVRNSNFITIYANGVPISTPVFFNGQVGGRDGEYRGAYTSLEYCPPDKVYMVDFHLARNENITTRPFSSIDFISGSTVVLFKATTPIRDETTNNREIFGYLPSIVTNTSGPALFNNVSFYLEGHGWPQYLDAKVGLDDTKDIFNTQIGSGDFTVEFWYKPGVWCGAFAVSDSNPGNNNYFYYNTCSGIIGIGFNGVKRDIFSAALKLKGWFPASWSHIAIVRKTGRIGVYINGAPIPLLSTITGESSYSILASGAFNLNSFLKLSLNQQSNNLQDFHISKFAKYDVASGSSVGTITVPTAPLTNTEFENSVVVKAELVPPLFTENDSLVFTGTGTENIPLVPLSIIKGAFTVEFWMYPADTTFNSSCLLFSKDGSTFWSIFINYPSDKKQKITIQNSNLIATTANTCVKYRQWNHVAMVVTTDLVDNLKLYVNGNLELVTRFIINSRIRPALPTHIGNADGGYKFIGGLSNIHIKNIASFDGVPTAAPEVTNLTLFLYKAPYQFYSYATSIKYQLQEFPTPYVTTGGSYSFSSSKLSAYVLSKTLDLNTNNPFTIQLWMYLLASQSCNNFIAASTNKNSINYRISIFNNSLQLIIGSSVLYTSSALESLQWHHIALTQDNNKTLRLYINGALVATRIITQTILNTNSIIFDNNKQLIGYLSDINVLRENLYGDAESISLPTQDLAITNSAAYLPNNYTNTYNYYENKLPFLVKPNITAFSPNSPFGEGIDGSIKPNTTGLVTFNPINEVSIGEQNFTIEWWDYIESFSQKYYNIFSFETQQYFPIFQILDKNNTSYIWFSHVIGSGPYWSFSHLRIRVGSPSENGLMEFNLSYTFNVWTHYALVKNGNTYTLYKNGIKISSKTNTTTLSNTTGKMLIGSVSPIRPHGFAPFETPQRNGYISNLRIVVDEALYQGNNVDIPTEPLNYIPKTLLLYKAPYTSEYITTYKSSTVSLVLGESISEFDPSPFISETEDCMFFDGNYTYIVPDATPSRLDLGSGDPYTVEFWLYNISTKNCVLFSRAQYSLSVIDRNLQWSMRTTKNSTVTAVYKNFTKYLRKWTHIAIVYDGTAINMYINGSRKDIAALGAGDTFVSNVSAIPVTIGNRYNAPVTDFSQCYFGYISNFKVSNINIYSGESFTVPTEPLTENNANFLLTSPYPEKEFKYITDCPFPSIVPEKTGFLNNYKYLKTAESLPSMSEDFTIELWFYSIRTNRAKEYMLDGRSPGNNQPFLIGLNEQLDQVRVQETEDNYIDVGLINPNTWYHLAVVRTNNYIQVYINGILEGGMYSIISTWPGNQLLIGKKNADNRSGECNFMGYISNIRIVRDEAVYNTNFTPPTEPFVEDSTYTFLLKDRVILNNTLLTTETTSLSNLSEQDIHISSALLEDTIEERSIILDSKETINNLYIHNKSTLHIPNNLDTELSVTGSAGLQITSEGKLNIT